jgi:serine/threonine-protein kinase
MLSGGHALVADFGIARAVTEAGSNQKLTETGMAVGTPLYMSPEQAVGDNVGPTSDLYSLACVLYEMLAGHPPFTGSNARQIMARHAMEQVPSIQVVRDTVPDQVEDAIMAALNKVIADRPQTAAQFSELLGAPPGATASRYSAVSRASVARRASRMVPAEGAVTVTVRRRFLYGTAVVVTAGVLLLVAGLVWYLRRGTGAGPGGAIGGLDPKRVAVLYFGDLSSDKHLGYVADGLTEALIGELSQVQELNVVSKGGVGGWRDSTSATPDSIARALQAGTLVQGRVEPTAGDKIRVQVWLVDGNSGADLGKRASFERPASDLIGARDSLATQAADLIRQQLGQEVKLRGQQEGTRSTAAWSMVQRAEVLHKSGEAADEKGDTATYARAFQSADSLLGKAEELDPKWPDPVVLRGRLAYLRSRRYLSEPLTAAKWIETGMGHIQRAFKLDDQNPDALELRGNLQYWKYLLRLEQDSAKNAALRGRARADFELATRLRPAQAGAWASLSHLYGNDPSTSLTDVMFAARRAYEADAFLSNAPKIVERLFLAAFDLDQSVDAAHWCEEGMKRFPTNSVFTTCQIYLMTMKGQKADPAKAWQLAGSEVLEKDQSGGTPEFQKAEARMIVAGVLARAGLKDSAKAVAKSALATSEVDPTRFLYLQQSYVLALADDKAGAIQALKTFLVTNPERRAEFQGDPGWKYRTLVNEPAFVALIGTK